MYFTHLFSSSVQNTRILDNEKNGIEVIQGAVFEKCENSVIYRNDKGIFVFFDKEKEVSRAETLLKNNDVADNKRENVYSKRIPEGSGNLAERATKDGVCSLLYTRAHYIVQPWYYCYTCDLTRNVGCCATCAKLHTEEGHDVRYAKTSGFYCDCYLSDGKCFYKQKHGDEY